MASWRGGTKSHFTPRVAPALKRCAWELTSRGLSSGSSLRGIRFTACRPETRQLLQISPDLLRDRRLLPLNLDTVDMIRIRTPAGSFRSVARETGGW